MAGRCLDPRGLRSRHRLVISRGGVASVPSRRLAAAGLIGGLLWIALKFAPIDGDSEVFWSRLWAPLLVLMALGFLGLRRSMGGAGARAARIGLALLVGGLLIMALGNVAEYWAFVDQRHGELNPRNFSWLGLLLGLLVGSIGATVAGIAMLLRHAAPAWVSGPLAFLLVAIVAVGALDQSWSGVPLGVSAVASGIFGLRITGRGDL